MKLPFNLFKTKKEDIKYYLGLILTSEKVSAVAFKESAGNIQIINRKNQYFTKNLDSLELEELIEIVNKAISQVEEILPPDTEIRQTVFGVKASWIDHQTNKIQKDYLIKLKKVCDALDLSPIGYMVISDAIANLILHEDGAPLSALIIDLGRQNITVTLFKGGKNFQEIEAVVRENVVMTVNELLKTIRVEVLPARIILYDSEISDELGKQFMGYHWSKSLPFLHVPQVSILPQDYDCKALTYGAAVQMGFEVIGTDVIPPIKLLKPDLSEDTAIKTSENVPDKEKQLDILPHQSAENIAKEGNFGFLIDKDVAEMRGDLAVNNLESKTEKTNLKDIQSVRADNFESIDQAIPGITSEFGLKPEMINKNLQDARLTEPSDSEHLDEVTSKKRFSLKPGLIPAFWLKFVIIPLIIIGIICGAIYYYYSFSISAAITLDLTPKKVAKKVDIILSPESGNDFARNVLSAKAIDNSIEGDMSQAATGKKEVGEKARGTVTLYNNNTGSDITLAKGTAIESTNGLEFTLDKDVKIASASGDVFTGTKPGTTDASVTAEDIGSNYNLPSGTKFSISLSNSLAAKNDNAFAGGSSKTVTVVSGEDLSKLSKNLLAHLESKAVDVLGVSITRDESVLPIVLESDLSKTEYDKKAGDEAKSVKLSAILEYTVLTYKNSDLADLAEEILEENYPDNKPLNEKDIEIELKEVSKAGGSEISASLLINGLLYPKIDIEKLKNDLSGNSRQKALNLISGLPQIRKTTIKYNPNIPFIDMVFPNLPKNVSINISSN